MFFVHFLGVSSDLANADDDADVFQEVRLVGFCEIPQIGPHDANENRTLTTTRNDPRRTQNYAFTKGIRAKNRAFLTAFVTFF